MERLEGSVRFTIDKYNIRLSSKSDFFNNRLKVFIEEDCVIFRLATLDDVKDVIKMHKGRNDMYQTSLAIDKSLIKENATLPFDEDSTEDEVIIYFEQ